MNQLTYKVTSFEQKQCLTEHYLYIRHVFGVFISQQTPSVDDDTLMLANSSKNAHPFPKRTILMLMYAESLSDSTHLL